jgi:hypothetical protein
MHTSDILGAGLDFVDIDRLGSNRGVGGSGFIMDTERFIDMLGGSGNAAASTFGDAGFMMDAVNFTAGFGP